ncbi:MAG: hypothetical protein AAF799_29270 [Myxococcota bacterium]
MIHRRTILSLAVLLAGCSPEAPVTPPSSTPPPAAAEPGSNAVVASLLEAQPTGNSAPAARVTLRFTNGTASAVNVGMYVLEWPGGRFEARPKDLSIPAGGEVERSARIDSQHGDVGALLADPDAATLSVEAH